MTPDDAKRAGGGGELEDLFRRLTDALERLAPTTTPPQPEAQRTGFAYDLLTSLLGRRTPGGEPVPSVVVRVTREPNRRLVLHREGRAAAATHVAVAGPAFVREVAAIAQEAVTFQQVPDDAEIPSVLLLQRGPGDDRDWPVVGIGPRLVKLNGVIG